MKKYFFVLSLIFTLSLQAQLLSYGDLGVLTTQNSKQGTARSMAMKDAFGALGGDLSAISINPAGAAVFSTSMITGTFGYNELGTDATFYTGKSNQITENFALSQIGAALVFENDSNHSNFKKFVFGVNYQRNNNFKNDWTVGGGTIPTWSENYFNTDDNNIYNNVKQQSYQNKTTGKQTELNLNLAADVDNKLYLGASLNSHNFELEENASRHEIAFDEGSNSVDALEKFWQEVKGEGISLSVGLIYKPIHTVRLGFSYNSPIWYNITEYNNMYREFDGDYVGNYNVLYSYDPPAYYNSSSKTQTFDYQMRTPSKATASLAFVIGKTGLLSADFSRKNYGKIHLTPESDFKDAITGFDHNKDIQEGLKESYALNLGTEWRLDKFSIRGGYSYEQTPYKINIDTDNKQGYAFGLGYNFGNYSIDVAYDYTTNTSYYDFYPEFSAIKGADLTQQNHKVNATFSFKF